MHTPDQSEGRRVVAYTDGGCLGNPGPGGYAAVLTCGDETRIVRGREPATTNNRMELMGAIRAVEAVEIDLPLTIVSDSEYVVKGINEWIGGWKKRGWRTAGSKPVLNRDLWERLDGLVTGRPLGATFTWTKGHAGTPLNEEADRIANEEAAAAARGAGPGDSDTGWRRQPVGGANGGSGAQPAGFDSGSITVDGLLDLLHERRVTRIEVGERLFLDLADLPGRLAPAHYDDDGTAYEDRIARSVPA